MPTRDSLSTPFARPLPASGEYLDFPASEVEQSVPQRFAAQAVRFAERLAVQTRRQALTYRALDERAQRCARELLARRGDREEPIAVLLGNEAPTIAAFLGVLQAGKIYVPIDPTLPAARRAWLIEDAGAALVVTDRAHRDLACAAAGNKPLLDLDELEADSSTDFALPALAPDRLAWILYTSGSTGQPKGVLQTHRNLLHFSRNTIRLTRVSVADRVGLFFSFAANAAPFEMLCVLLAGASLHPLDVRQEGVGGLADWLARQAVTIYASVPTVFRHWLDALDGRENLSSVRLVKLVGEATRPDDVARFRRYFPPTCVLANRLSSTETGMVRCYLIDAATPAPITSVPVGYAIEGEEVLLCDEGGTEVPPGEPGEIVVRSRYLTPGYWRRPELNAAVFTPADAAGLRTYRTGDLGRMLPDGCLLHLGRKDFQVKIRGQRIELGEIEAALRATGVPREAVVVARPVPDGDAQLVAYLVGVAEPLPSAAAVRRQLAAVLPDYMVPTQFILLDELPRAANGKVLRHSLPEPGTVPQLVDAPYRAPRLSVEIALTALWEELLDARPLGVDDNFFDRGGYSLLGVQLLDRLEALCGLRPPASLLLSAPTIAELARWVVEQRPATAQSRWVCLRPGNGRPPFFYLHGDFHGGGVSCLEIARHLDATQPFYTIAPPGADDDDVPLTIEGMAAAYLAGLRAVRPHGPYRLGGHCNGGLMAYEMARQLHAAGETVDLLVLFEIEARAVWQHATVGRFNAESYQRLYPPRGPVPSRSLAGLSRTERESALWDVLLDAIGHYVLFPWPGRATIFHAEFNGEAQRDPTLGWREFTEVAETCALPGDHVSCFARHAPAVAEQLTRCLNRLPATGA